MKIKIAVLFGGKSVEHEVSIISAIQALNAINKDKYEVIPIYLTKENEMYTGAFVGNIEEYTDIPALLKKSEKVILSKDNGKVCVLRCSRRKNPFDSLKNSIINTVDIAFPIVHGTNVEDGTLQGFLKIIGVPFVGCDVGSSAAGMDKFVTKAVLRFAGIPVLDCVRFRADDFVSSKEELLSKLEKEINFPLIIKPLNLGSSVGIRLAKNKSECAAAIEHALLFANEILAEHAVTDIKEVNVSVIGDGNHAEASECEEPVHTAEILSYEDKYAGGLKSETNGAKSGMVSLKRKIPAEITNETRDKIRRIAVDAFKALNCSGVSRADFIIDLDTDKIYFNEINTIPGSLSFYLWEPLGVTYPELLERVIKLALKRERENSSVNFSFNTNILKNAKLGGKGSK